MKKILSILLILFLTVSLSACAPGDENPPVDPGTPEVEEPVTDDSNDDTEDPIEEKINDEDAQEPVEEEKQEEEEKEEEKEEEQDEVDEEEAKKEKEADLYFANLSYVETGDESLDHLKVEKRMIVYEDIIFEEAVVKELLKGTEEEDLTTGIPETLNLLEVKVMDGMATVDFASDGLSGASLQETLTIEQIVETLTNLEGIEKVQFLVDGKEADSLMGHITIDQPFEGK